MELPVKLSILLLFLIWCFADALDDSAKFEPNTLKTLKECKTFSLQKSYRISKAMAYYNNKTLWLDEKHQHNLLECARFLATMTDGTVPSFFYYMQGIENYTAEHRKVIRELNTEVMDNVEMIPVVKFFLGPKGKNSEIAKGLVQLYSEIGLAASEVESITMAYNQEFFDSLNRSLLLSHCSQQYLVLNGWHLRNMQTEPVLRPDFNQIYAGIVIWVTRERAHMIAKDEVSKAFNGTYMAIVLDMPGSPEHSGAEKLAVVALILVMVVGLVDWLG